MLSHPMEFPEEFQDTQERVYSTLFKETIFQASSVTKRFFNLLEILADCNGGDNELKPYQVPIDFYSSGVTCAQCQVIIPDPWYDKLNKVLSFE